MAFQQISIPHLVPYLKEVPSTKSTTNLVRHTLDGRLNNVCFGQIFNLVGLHEKEFIAIFRLIF